MKYYDSSDYLNGLSKAMMMPIKFYNLAYVKTNSYIDAPISSIKDNYPLILFSHGYSGSVGQNTIQMEHLASKGYIVVSISHAYEALGANINGEFIGLSDKALDMMLESVQELQVQGLEGEALHRQLVDSKKMGQRLLEWALDSSFVIDELEALNKNHSHQLHGKIDLDNIGILGHSFGGATAGLTSVMDDRIKAGINMDGSQFASLYKEKIQQPFMVLVSASFNKYIKYGYHPEDDIKSIMINQSKHFNFSDMSYLMPALKYLNALGSIDANRMKDLNNRLITYFFDEHLKNINKTKVDQLVDENKELEDI